MAHPICWALIVAGGKGLRLDPAHPKQYLPILGKPILIHTLERFYHSGLFQGAIVVLPSADVAVWPAWCRQYNLDERFFEAAAGGATRFDSVGAGLAALNRRTGMDGQGFTSHHGHTAGKGHEAHAADRSEVHWVAVHDGVRPLVSTAFLKNCLEAAFQYGNAVPALTPVESFRYLTEAEAEVPTISRIDVAEAEAANRPIDRNRLRSLQTPQCARLQRLSEAWHLAAARPEPERTDRFTDEATVLEYAGDRIHLCDGSPFNLKITRPIDLSWAEHILKQSLV